MRLFIKQEGGKRGLFLSPQTQAFFKKARDIALDEKGAIVVEYVLLLVAGAAIAQVLITALTKYPGGFFIKWWRQILINIASDMRSS